MEAHESALPLVMSVANVAEVWYTFARETTSEQADEALGELKQLRLEFWDVTLELALQAAKFKAQHKLSPADCFAAALAMMKNIPVVTGDREFAALADAIKIVWL